MAEISSHIWLECKSSLIATKWDENCFRQNIIPSAKFFCGWQSKKMAAATESRNKKSFFSTFIFMVIQLNDLVTVRLTLSCYSEMTTTPTKTEYKSIHITHHRAVPCTRNPLLLVLFVELHHSIDMKCE